MFQWQRFHFIDELQRHGVEFDIFNPLFFGSHNEATEAVIKKLDNENYDLFFTNLCNENHVDIEVLNCCKHKGIPTLSFRSDNYVIPFLDEHLSPYFDLVWITSQETRYLYDKFGARTLFAPYAANPYFFQHIENVPLIRKACFVGTPHSSRANFINQLTYKGLKVDAFFLKDMSKGELDIDIPVIRRLPMPGFIEHHYNLMRFKAGRTMLYASVVNRFKKQTSLENNDYLEKLPRVPFDKISEVYSEYALSLAFTSLQHTDVLKNPIKIVDLRNFEVPMCGGIIFCRYHDEMASYFEPSKEIVMYDSKEDLIDKATYYINKAPESEIRLMKTAARKRAEFEHTWTCRFNKAFEVIGLPQI